MYITKDEKALLIRELTAHLHAHLDGSKTNLLVPVCPVCGKSGYKFGIYIGAETTRKKPFMSHCFKCGATTRTLNDLLKLIDRPDLRLDDVARFPSAEELLLPEEEELDDELVPVEMPSGWKRCFRNPYLKERGLNADDFEYFPVGTTRGLNFKFDNYVVFPIIDEGETVGYVGRHTWPKEQIDQYNDRARWAGKYEIRRYNNSNENNFVKLLYNYDSVVEDVTDTVIIVEGVFDVIALTRKLELYDNERVGVVATFGKKISDIQMYKLQRKGVKTIVLAYDSDAREATIKAAETLSEYFDVFITYLNGKAKDFDEASFWEIFEAFNENLLTPREFVLRTI